MAFIFLTGYDKHDMLRKWAIVPALAKPAGEAEPVANVEALLTRGGKARNREAQRRRRRTNSG